MASDRLWEHNSSKKVILDTSGIMMVFEFKIDLENQLRRVLGNFEIVIPSSVINELNSISKKGKEKKKTYAKLGLSYINNYRTKMTEGKADDDVLLLAEKYKGIIVTNDKEIRKKAKKKLIKTIYLRSKKYLVLE